jgi:hypothetical protein
MSWLGEAAKSKCKSNRGSSFDSNCAKSKCKSKCGFFDSRAARSAARSAQDDIRILALRMTGNFLSHSAGGTGGVC